VREAPVHESPVRETAQAAPVTPAGASATRPAASGRVDAEWVSQQWPEILEAVKRERRVAWMLLSNAAVHSVDDRVLTVRFAREGDVKGFSSSGCDRDLGRVLDARFGLKLQVKAIFAAQLGGTLAGPPPSAPRDPAQPDPSAAYPDEPDPAEWDPMPSGSGPSGSMQSGGAPSGSVRSASARPDSREPDPAQPDPGRSASARSASARPEETRAGLTRSGSARTDAAPSGRGSGAPMAGREDLTGMDLIKRELGGKIIAEIDEA